MPTILNSHCAQLDGSTTKKNKPLIIMGVIYKILKQQRQQQQQQQQQHLRQMQCNNMDLSMATKCKVQAAIKQRQLQRLEVRQQQQQQEQQQDTNEDAIAEQQLQQLYQFLAENASRKKRQRQRLRMQQMTGDDAEQPLCELQATATGATTATTTHDMDLLMEQLNTCDNSQPSSISEENSSNFCSSNATAPRDSILLKIRHQIFERKRQQRQRQLAELVEQRLVVWRPW
ncbi:serum response factor homolog A [Drosophila sulfurigaster albostrigata]|uniref:serum response factor homolog A n=1 Tax=Drosophila sulfurigaster albostrigata TaxID=89887 RepID=UPI002D21C802|nr:serum response factor homolog A [Drosophila sulfurigaster albostrigata]